MSLVDEIRERGPVTVAAFMDLALYDPRFGYYARAARRSGRAGDFFTSVDVGTLFGELLERQIAEMADLLDQADRPPTLRDLVAGAHLDLVEVGAGTGQLAADMLAAARARHPKLYERLRLHLVEASAAARGCQRETLGNMTDRLVSSGANLPTSFEGILLANELLDAMPVHQVVMREDGLREVYVRAVGKRLTTVEAVPSTTALTDYLDELGVELRPGWRVEINLNATAWILDAARRLRRGFVILIDYGHEAPELYSVAHAHGTLSTFSRHATADPDGSAGTPRWLERPGEQDLTAHVDFTSVRRAAERGGLVSIGFLDQTYFLLGLLEATELDEVAESSEQLRRRLALKTLLVPGGLGSTMKVMVFGKNVGRPRLRGCAGRTRVT